MGKENLDWFIRVAEELEEDLDEKIAEYYSDDYEYWGSFFIRRNMLSKHPSLVIRDEEDNDEISTIYFDPYYQVFYKSELPMVKWIINDYKELIDVIVADIESYVGELTIDEDDEEGEFEFTPYGFNGYPQELSDLSSVGHFNVGDIDLDVNDIEWMTEKKLSKELKMDLPHKPDSFRFNSYQVHMQLGETDDGIIISRGLTRNYDSEEGDNFSIGQNNILIIDKDEIDDLMELLKEYKKKTE